MAPQLLDSLRQLCIQPEFFVYISFQTPFRLSKILAQIYSTQNAAF